MKHYRHDPEYIRLQGQAVVLDLQIAAITAELSRREVRYLRDKVPTPRDTRAELLARRSSLRLASQQLSAQLAEIRLANSKSSEREFIEVLRGVLEEAGAGHLFVQACHIHRKTVSR